MRALLLTDYRQLQVRDLPVPALDPAEILVRARACDIPAAVADRTAGQGADHVVEAVGQPDAVATAIASARKGGTVTLVGNVAPAVELPLQSVVTRALTLIGSCASAGEYPACLEMMGRGAVRVEPLISTVTSLDDAPQWFERLYRRDAGVLKVVVQPCTHSATRRPPAPRAAVWLWVARSGDRPQRGRETGHNRGQPRSGDRPQRGLDSGIHHQQGDVSWSATYLT